MTHRRRPHEQMDSLDEDLNDGAKRFDDRNSEGREHRSRWHPEERDDSNCDGSSEGSEGKYSAWDRGDEKKDRVDGWSDKKSSWEDRHSKWEDRKSSWKDREHNWEERKSSREDRTDDRREDWSQRSGGGRDHWSERKDGWNKRRDDPWESKERSHDDVDKSRGGRGSSRERERRNRSRERRDRNRDKSRDRDQRSYRSYSRSPDRDRDGSSQTSLAGEWICKCGALNFKRRVSCFRSRCGAPRSEAVSMVTNQSRSVNAKQGNALGTMIATQQFSVEDIPALATYSAKMYAGNKTEHSTYLKYYTDYYTQMLAQKNSLEGKSETDKVNVAAAVAQSAINQVQAKANLCVISGAPVKCPPTGTDNKVYSVPDVSTYMYDQTSGYYYDPSTGLYYDPTTQYYYNNQINQYLYWDTNKRTYILASTLQNYNQNASSMANATLTTPTEESAPQAEDDKKGKTIEKTDKVKVAKKIAKDMERWARAMNQKKEIAKANMEPQVSANASSSKSADIGYSILDTQRVPSITCSSQAPVVSQPATLVPSYGGGSDSSGDECEQLIDWEKLACLLCKRQFPSRDVLEKHQLMSELHKQNLENLKGKQGGKSSKNRDSVTYRDRAAERRLKYGEDDEPVVRATRPDPVVSSAPREIGEENIGNRLLKKMGWTVGKGLGKEGQGILGPVEATTTGLGRKKGIYTAGPGETYRGCVKKLTMARYQDLIGSENNS